MYIQWLGHSFFLVESLQGVRLAFDPFGENVGYPLTEVRADFVFVSHDHFDHNNLKLIQGYREVFKEAGHFERGSLKISIFPTYHDEEKGKKRGKNYVTRVETEGIALIHAGDLGVVPEKEELESWKPVDILLLPVGGVYTIDAQRAKKLVQELHPRIVVPMHYKTRYLQFELANVEPFLQGFVTVKRIKGSHFEITAEKLPQETEVWVLEI